jgi:hypothetical protein
VDTSAGDHEPQIVDAQRTPEQTAFTGRLPSSSAWWSIFLYPWDTVDLVSMLGARSDEVAMVA